jgi:pimeloyl-ACP methyl ester carboxylesterase
MDAIGSAKGRMILDMVRPMPAVPRPRHFYTEPDWIDVGEVRVAYRRKGGGEPVLYLHGNGFTRMWLPFLERLSGSVDLIAPEHPGYGETEMPAWLRGFDDLVVHYDELLDLLGLETAHVVGYSLGGWIAAELAAFYPRRLRSLTLICPAGLRIPGQHAPNLTAMTTEAVWETLFNDPRNAGSVLPDYESLEEVVHLYGEATTFARLTWNPQYDLALERRLRRVTCPALVIGAELDRVIPDAVADRYAELLGARLERVPETGHAIAVERPDRVAELIAAHVRGAAAR